MPTSRNVRPVRSDAARNREHLLSVAEEGFALEGVELSMDAIAKRAGVGPGTLYRHFPTRAALVAAVLEGRYLDLERERSAIVAEEVDPLAALERWLDAVSTWARSYEGLTQPLSLAHESQTSPLAPTCQQVIAATEVFLQAAQRERRARQGVTARDLFMATLAAVWAAGGKEVSERDESAIRDILRSGWATD